MPMLKVKLNDKANLQCCYSSKTNKLVPVWHKLQNKPNSTWTDILEGTDPSRGKLEKMPDITCGTLTFESVQLNNSGFYRCSVGNNTTRYSHGTYLHVYEPLRKTINISENTKNKILTAEGILLLLCVILPATTLLCQSKKLNELERKKMKREEENIYQGLNLDDCCATYDQIERSQAHGPYQDVCNIVEEEEEIQLEKP
ncbi:B-cell antigen receptor complex-associated protein alpha chain [Symphorus nematophorus]